MHKDAKLAHMASAAAHEQGKFWEFHDKVFANQAKIQLNDLKQYAQELGLDMKRFEDALTTSKFRTLVEADTAEAMALGATGTPAFFVNGRFLSGARPFTDFAKLINAELTRLGLPIPPEAANAGG